MLILANLDNQITKFIFSIFPHSQFIEYFFSFFSLRGNSIFIWAFIIMLLLIFEERKNPGISKKDIAFLTMFTVCFVTASLISQIVIKNIVKRPRPCVSLTASVGNRLAQCPDDYSFPSSHATTAFASAVIITAFDKKRGWIYFTVAVLISLSRIILGYHYFFDVIAGSFMGWIISNFMLFRLRKTLRGLL